MAEPAASRHGLQHPEAERGTPDTLPGEGQPERIRRQPPTPGVVAVARGTRWDATVAIACQPQQPRRLGGRPGRFG